jgi:hypothetical protein
MQNNSEANKIHNKLLKPHELRGKSKIKKIYSLLQQEIRGGGGDAEPEQQHFP